jgi:hypothetical protein
MRATIGEKNILFENQLRVIGQTHAAMAHADKAWDWLLAQAVREQLRKNSLVIGTVRELTRSLLRTTAPKKLYARLLSDCIE